MDIDPGRPLEYHEVLEYCYENLVSKHIRIYQMYRAEDFDSEISGELSHVSLAENEDPTHYNALSYSWGPTYRSQAHLSASITCNGRKLRVTPALKTALGHIRSYGHRKHAQIFADGTAREVDTGPYQHFAHRPLWVDAICIDQTDQHERARQVEMMATIYHRSRSVIVWLGEADPWMRSQLVTTQAVELDHVKQTSDKQRQEVDESTPLWSAVTPSTPLTNTSLSMPSRRALLEWVLCRSWFQRRWVLQEMMYARECDILIGNFVCSRQQMRQMLEEAGMLARALPLLPHHIDSDMLKVCWKFDSTQCSEPRDRIYALRHMSKDGLKLRVDYNRSVRWVYLQMLLDTVLTSDGARSWNLHDTLDLHVPQKHKCLQMLAIASCKPTGNSADEIEAWIPDWRITSSFASASHRSAVETCMSQAVHGSPLGDKKEYWALPHAIEGASGSWYYCLEVQSRLLLPTKALSWQSTTPAERLRDELFRSKICSDLPNWKRENGRIYVPYLRQRSLLVAFILRRGRSWATLQGKPVYALHSCFSVINNRDPRTSALFDVIYQELRGPQGAPDEVFYLE